MAFTINNSRYKIEADDDILIFVSPYGVLLPKGDNSKRKSNPTEGIIRFNTDTKNLELFDNTEWVNLKPTYNSTSVTSSSYTLTNEDYIGINYVPTDIVLPDSPNEGRKITIKDETNNVNQVNRILVKTSDGTKIDNEDTLIITNKLVPVELLYANGKWNIITSINNKETSIERFKIEYDKDRNISSISNVSSGIKVDIIDSNSYNSTLSVTFGEYTYPPASILVYGINTIDNSYNFGPLSNNEYKNKLVSSNAFGNLDSTSLKINAKESNMNILRVGPSNDGISSIWSYNEYDSENHIVRNNSIDKAIYIYNNNQKLIKLDYNMNEIYSKILNSQVYDIIFDSNNNLYVCNNNGEILRLDKSDFSIIWQYTLSNNTPKTLTKIGDYLYIGDHNGNLSKIDKNNNVREWKYNHFNNTLTVLRNDSYNNIYGVSNDNRLIKFDTKGNKLWSIEKSNNGILALDINNQDYIFFGDKDGRIIKVNTNGEIEWESYAYKSGNIGFNYSEIRCISSDSVGNVFVGTANNELHKLDIFGNLIWVFLGHSGEILSVDYDNDNNILYSASKDQTVKKHDDSGDNKTTHCWIQFVMEKP